MSQRLARRVPGGEGGSSVAGARSDDLLVETPGLGLRRDPEIALQRSGACLVLTARRPEPAAFRLESHDGPVDRLQQRVEGDQAERRDQREFIRSGPELMREE